MEKILTVFKAAFIISGIVLVVVIVASFFYLDPLLSFKSDYLDHLLDLKHERKNTAMTVEKANLEIMDTGRGSLYYMSFANYLSWKHEYSLTKELSDNTIIMNVELEKVEVNRKKMKMKINKSRSFISIHTGRLNDQLLELRQQMDYNEHNFKEVSISISDKDYFYLNVDPGFDVFEIKNRPIGERTGLLPHQKREYVFSLDLDQTNTDQEYMGYDDVQIYQIRGWPSEEIEYSKGGKKRFLFGTRWRPYATVPYFSYPWARILIETTVSIEVPTSSQIKNAKKTKLILVLGVITLILAPNLSDSTKFGL